MNTPAIWLELAEMPSEAISKGIPKKGERVFIRYKETPAKGTVERVSSQLENTNVLEKKTAGMTTFYSANL